MVWNKHFEGWRELMEMKPKRRAGIRHWHRVAILLVAFDMIAVNAAYFLALWFRYDGQYTQIPPESLYYALNFAPIYTVACVAVFCILSMCVVDNLQIPYMLTGLLGLLQYSLCCAFITAFGGLQALMSLCASSQHRSLLRWSMS